LSTKVKWNLPFYLCTELFYKELYILLLGFSKPYINTRKNS